jgi:hypothetical protein
MLASLSSLILAAALAGQAPAAPRGVGVAPPRRPAPAAARPPDDKSALIARRRAKRARLNAAEAAAEYREYRAAVAAAEYEVKMLPYRLEMQRQMLQRQSEFEANVARNRAAGALEKMANSPLYNDGVVRGTPPGPPVTSPMWWAQTPGAH